ncbi:transcription subunit (intermediate) large subunit [Squirrelpox virus]|uniref:Intermediate transcription factor 3 large subunit n=1 Tax=Squirrelpox virus TaxID=240426 RepID=Q1HTS5_9POXV|nr:transcription subunit (intermediate) large subunit [Squirrelpox virus]ABD51461.1 F1R [Squirrelpox virus]CCD83295.1 transcription subunit (intermediate) large subunit [Squirrelpox virus]
MEELLHYLRAIEDRYARTIFNFHLLQRPDIGDVYGAMRDRISSTNAFAEAVGDAELRRELKKLVYCDIQLTKHLLNHAAYPTYSACVRCVNRAKRAQYFDVRASPGAASERTAEIFECDKSSLVSYVKTTNKRLKVDYGEIKKTIHGYAGSGSAYFSGRRSDEYLMTTVNADADRPWIKSIVKRLRVDVTDDAIVTRGKSSILQTIDIVFVNRTCVKVFKDSTIHVILSKDKNERGCVGMLDRIFHTYRVLFVLLRDVTGDASFAEMAAAAARVAAAGSFDEKMALIADGAGDYGVGNFRVGMFNLTHTRQIASTVFPSLLDDASKIKFFKGKKLNIVAIGSLEECRRYVEQADWLLDVMARRSATLDALDIARAPVDALKDLLK